MAGLHELHSFFLAVEKRDHATVKGILESYPDKENFITYMHAIPSMIFPRGLYDDDPFLITPVTLALRQEDLAMVNLFCNYKNLKSKEDKITKEKETFCWAMQPLIKRKISGFSRKMKLSLCLDVLRNNEHFFKGTELLALQDIFKSTLPNDLTLKVAKLILAIEQNNLELVKELLNDSTFALNELARDSYFSSNSILVREEDIDKEWITKLYFEKSLVLVALENKNIEIYEYLEKAGFDITNLGKFTQYITNSKERNQMLLCDQAPSQSTELSISQPNFKEEKDPEWACTCWMSLHSCSERRHINFEINL